MNRCTILTAALAMTACAGTETDNPLHDFAGTECKSQEEIFAATREGTTKGTGDPSVPVVSTSLMQDHAAELAGLRCVAWEHGPGGEITVDAVNFQGPCSGSYGAAELVRAENDIYEVRLVTDDAAGCGACTYDWTFTFTPDAADAERLHLRVVTGYGFGDDPTWTTKFEAIIKNADAVSCEEATLTHGLAPVGCAQAFTDCADLDTGSPDELAETCGVPVGDNGCQQGLECVASGCRAPCETTADCGESGALLCVAGVCRAAPSLWVK